MATPTQRGLAGQPHAALAICVRTDPQRDQGDETQPQFFIGRLPPALAPGASVDGHLRDDVDSIASLLFGAPLERLTRDELIDAVLSAGATAEETLQIVAAGIIASPAFQWR